MNTEYLKFNRERAAEIWYGFTTREIMLWTLVSVIFVLIASYIFLINNTIYTSVDWKNKLTEIEKVNHDIAISESEYIALGNSIDITRAASLGLLQSSQISYIPKISHSNGLSLRTNE
jgi:hypothetical protein